MTAVLINKCFRFFALTALLWLIVIYGFGINIPLLTKTTPRPNTLKTTLKLPQDFTIQVFASHLPGIRTLLPTPTGDLIATLPKKGQVILLKKTPTTPKASQQATILLSGLNLPSGLAFYKNWLYIAESHAIGRIHMPLAAFITTLSSNKFPVTTQSLLTTFPMAVITGPERLNLVLPGNCLSRSVPVVMFAKKTIIFAPHYSPTTPTAVTATFMPPVFETRSDLLGNLTANVCSASITAVIS